jgi:integrase
MTRRRAGTVRKLSSGRWQARYLDPAGRRLTAPLTFRTKGDAQRWLAATETDLNRGEWHDPRHGKVLFGAWADQWLATKAPKLQPSTAELYRYLLRRHVVPTFGSVPIGRLSAAQVHSWLADLHSTKLSPNTVAKAYRVLSGVMDGAVQAQLIPYNPCTIKGAGTERHPEMQVATPEQVAAIASAAGPRWEALILTAAYGGLRWGELAALRRSDVDLTSGAIKVARKLGEVNGRLEFGPPKSAAGRRTIGVPSFVVHSLELHIERYALPGSAGLVFPSEENLPMRRSNFRRRVWLPAIEEAGVSGLRFHDLRHTAATLAAASGASVKALMARIGHASADASLRYQHAIDGNDAQIVKFLEGFAEVPPRSSTAERRVQETLAKGHREEPRRPNHSDH